MAEQLEIRIGVPYAIHVDAIAISNDNRDAFHRNFDAITEPRSAQLRNSQFLSKSGGGGCSNRRVVHIPRWNGGKVDAYKSYKIVSYKISYTEHCAKHYNRCIKIWILLPNISSLLSNREISLTHTHTKEKKIVLQRYI